MSLVWLQWQLRRERDRATLASWSHTTDYPDWVSVFTAKDEGYNAFLLESTVTKRATEILTKKIVNLTGIAGDDMSKIGSPIPTGTVLRVESWFASAGFRRRSMTCGLRCA
jgi:hypothetical protein